MDKKEIERRLLIFISEIDIEDIKNDFINDEVNEDVDHDEPIITDYDLVYLTLNNYINIYELKRLFLLQKNINDFDFKSMISEIEKIKREVENGK